MSTPKIPSIPVSPTDLFKEFPSPEALLSAIVDSTDDAIVSKNLQGIVTSWNRGAEKLFGYRAEEMIGKPITTLIPAERLEEEPKIIERLKLGERVDHFDTQRLRKDGTLVEVSLTISPVIDQQGTIVGASKIARDIGSRKRAETVLLRQQSKLEILNNLGKELTAQLDLGKLVQSVTDAGRALSGAAFGAFFYNQVNERGETYALYTLSGAPREAFEKFGIPRKTEIFRPTFDGEGVVRIADVLAGPALRKNGAASRHARGAPAGAQLSGGPGPFGVWHGVGRTVFRTSGTRSIWQRLRGASGGDRGAGGGGDG